MRVKIANRLYRMSKAEYEKLLIVAKEQVPFGIYAVEKKDYAELQNIRCKSITELKDFTRKLKMQGFKVLDNKG